MSLESARATLNRLWTAFALFMLVVATNIFAVVQWTIPDGVAPSPLSVTLGRDSPSVLYVGIPVVAVLILLSLWVCVAYFRLTEGTSSHWYDRVPVLFNANVEELEHVSRTGTLLWRGLPFVILTVALAMNLQQLHKFLVSGIPVVRREDGTQVSMFLPEWPSVLFSDAYRYSSIEGFTFWPLYTPIMFFLLELVVVGVFAKYVIDVLRIRSSTVE